MSLKRIDAVLAREMDVRLAITKSTGAGLTETKKSVSIYVFTGGSKEMSAKVFRYLFEYDFRRNAVFMSDFHTLLWLCL